MDTIWVIRHAEKPEFDIVGVRPDGHHDKESLIVRGWQRAGAWAVYFEVTHGPTRIYASDPEHPEQTQDGVIGRKSRRPLETISPLAARLQLEPRLKYARGQEAALVDELVTLTGDVLVAWQHEAIPDIATRILGTPNGVPAPWPADRFDVIWRFRRAEPGGPFTFDQVCPCLLAGDSQAPIRSS